jgi:hypothetical protein
MDAQTPNRISVTTNPTFRDYFVSSLLLMRYQPVFVVLYALFALFGLFLLMTPFLGYRLGPIEILLALLCFSFAPLITALTVWAARRQKMSKGPITYVFDSTGMHTSGQAFTQSIQWSGIVRVRRSKRFLFVFIAPARAHCIPLRDLSHPDDLDRLLAMADMHIMVQADAR